MRATDKQIAANRQNGRKGGVKTAAGRAVSRLNARKHGIFASALTRYDKQAVQSIHRELAAWIRPVGPIEQILVEKLAHTYVRLQRCARAEAEYHIATWQAKTEESAVAHLLETSRLGMHISPFDADCFERSVSLFARYDTTLTNQFVKLLHEIERLRVGDSPYGEPPPLATDATVRGVEGEGLKALGPPHGGPKED